MAQWSDEFRPLGRAYHWESVRAHETYLVQPMSDGTVRSWTWQQAMDEARRIATFLRARGWEPGSRIARLARSRAGWIRGARGAWGGGPGHGAPPPLIARGVYPHAAAARGCPSLLCRGHGRSRGHAAGYSGGRAAHRHAQCGARGAARLRPPLGRDPRRMPAPRRVTGAPWGRAGHHHLYLRDHRP